MGIMTTLIIGTGEPGRIGTASWFRWFSVHGKVDLLMRFLINFLIWHLFGIFLAYDWHYCNMFSVVIITRVDNMKYMFKIPFC